MPVRGTQKVGLSSLEETARCLPDVDHGPNRRFQALYQNGHISSVRVLLDVDADDGDVGEEWVLVGGGYDFGPALVRALDGEDDYAYSFWML